MTDPARVRSPRLERSGVTEDLGGPVYWPEPSPLAAWWTEVMRGSGVPRSPGRSRRAPFDA